MTADIVWKNKEYLGKGYVLQRADISEIGSANGFEYDKNPDPALKDTDEGYVERWRVVHLEDLVENYEELERDLHQRLGKELLKEEHDE